MKKISKFLERASNIWHQKVLRILKDPLFLARWDQPNMHGSEEDRITSWANAGYRTFLDRDEFIGDVYMFVQDMHQGVMPYVRRRDSNAYAAHLEPENDVYAGFIAQALGEGGRRSSRDLSEATSDFIERSVQSLFFYGKAVFEIKCDRDADSNITDFKFYNVYPPSVKKILGSYWQIITLKAAKHARIKAGIKRIPKERMLFIEFPRELGGHAGLREIINDLAYISREVLPDFQMEALKNQTNSGFRLNDYIWSRYVFKGRITRVFGWNQRKVPDNDMLEYYTIYRQLKFARSQALLRQHVLRQLNGKLNSPYVGMASNVRVENLLTVEDIDKELESFMKGGLKFVDLYNKITR